MKMILSALKIYMGGYSLKANKTKKVVIKILIVSNTSWIMMGPNWKLITKL